MVVVLMLVLAQRRLLLDQSRSPNNVDMVLLLLHELHLQVRGPPQALIYFLVVFFLRIGAAELLRVTAARGIRTIAGAIVGYCARLHATAPRSVG